MQILNDQLSTLRAELDNLRRALEQKEDVITNLTRELERVIKTY